MYHEIVLSLKRIEKMKLRRITGGRWRREEGWIWDERKVEIIGEYDQNTLYKIVE